MYIYKLRTLRQPKPTKLTIGSAVLDQTQRLNTEISAQSELLLPRRRMHSSLPLHFVLLPRQPLTQISESIVETVENGVLMRERKTSTIRVPQQEACCWLEPAA